MTPKATADSVPCGPDVGPIVDAFRQYVDAGFDRVYLNQMGPNQAEFFNFYVRELAPALAEIGASAASDASMVVTGQR